MSTRYNTGNPIESTDVRDMSDNAKNFDGFVNSTENSFIDRLGVTRKTIHGMNAEFDSNQASMNAEFESHILSMGFTRVGTFAAGATLTNTRQTLLWDVADGGDGQEYGWSGVFPLAGKVVPPGSTPLTTGGIAAGAWISRFDPELRIQVSESLRRSYAEAGYNLVDGSFEVGGTLINANDALLQERTGKAYAGAGPFPQDVNRGTDPTAGGYIDKSGELLKLNLGSSTGAKFIGYSGVMSVDDRLRMTGVSPSDREWNCTALTTDCATQIEEAWLKAQELKTNLILPQKYKVGRMLDMNCQNYFVGSEIIGNGKWSTGIEYTGSVDIDGLMDFRTVPGNTITTLAIRNAGFWGNRKADSLMSSLNGFAFTDLKIDNNLFNGGKVANIDIAAFVATIGNNYFRDGDGIGARIRDKPVGWVGGYQNTTLFYHNNYALYVAQGHDIRNVGYSEILANACDGESVKNAYTLVNVTGAFRNNGSERARRYGNFTACVLSEFSGYAAYMGIGLTGETIESLMYFDGGCDINWTGFNELDSATLDATYTNKIRVNRGSANLDIRVNCGGVRPSHFGLFGAPSAIARNPRGVRFANDQQYSPKDAGGDFMGGAVFNEYAGVSNDLASFKNPVSKSSLSFFLSGTGSAQVRLSNFPVSSITKTNAAMFTVRVRGMHKLSGETFEYIAHAGYANGGAFTVTYTVVKARAGGSPFTLSDSSGYLALNKNTSTGADCLFVVDVDAVAAGGVNSASMSVGEISQFF